MSVYSLFSLYIINIDTTVSYTTTHITFHHILKCIQALSCHFYKFRFVAGQEFKFKQPAPITASTLPF